LRHASAIEERMSSAMPQASFAATLAVQGAITSASHHSASETCPGTQVSGFSNSPVATLRRESVRNVSGVTNCCAPAVMITETSAPALTKSRTSSHAL